MKVIQINCVYPFGSTGKIVHEIHEGLINSEIKSVVCYGRGKKIDKEGIHQVSCDFLGKTNNLLSRITGFMYGGCMLSTGYLLAIILKEKPDIVHLHSVNGYFVNIYRLVEWLKVHHIKTVLTLHAEFMYTGNCSHSFDCEKWKTGCGHCPRRKEATKSLFLDRTAESYTRMKQAFSGFKNLKVVSVSPWLAERAKQAPVLLEADHSTILNGVNVECFTTYDTSLLRNELNIQNERVLFHVTAHFSDEKNHAKGGWAVIELAKRLSDLNIKIIVACTHSSLSTQLPSNMLLLGCIEEQKRLAQLYSLADLTVIASKKETFSMPCAESLCSGTPIVGFKAGAPERIALEKYSEFVEYGDLDGLETTVRNWLNTTHLNKKTISEEAHEMYSNTNMVNHYLELYGGLYEEESA